MINSSKIKRLVIVAYRLPFSFAKTNKGYKATQNSGGLVSAILALSDSFKRNNSFPRNTKIVWAGTANNIPDDFVSSDFENDHFEIEPVRLSTELDAKYYGGFCNDLIWPLFHYFPSYSVFNDEYFEAYKEANLKFCEELLTIIKPGDYVWIHDYQLMLLPEMLRAKIENITISFFLHIPFPSYEIFRLLPRGWRESIIKGLLGSDLVGFHTHDYTQHFLKSVKRTVGYEFNQSIVYTPNKLVKADAFPIGIDYDKFNGACNNEEVLLEKIRIKSVIVDSKLIFSVDRLDYSKGLLLKLRGYERFLETYPEWHSKVIFNMVVVPSRDLIAQYKEMKKEIEYTVGRINGKYSSLDWRPIVYQYKSLSFNQLVALYDMSDVGLITPMRDGMNLVAKEYIACQVENKGVLILSELAGAAAELNEAILINPVDLSEMSVAIRHALEMPKNEKLLRLSRMQTRISSYNVFTWAKDIFKETFDIKLEQEKMNVRFINKDLAMLVSRHYKLAKKRIIFLDYDGTLVPFSKFPELAIIDAKTLDIVKALAADRKNQVVIISGRDTDFLARQFDNVNVTLVAEHGYFIRRVGEDWVSSTHTDGNWKESVMPILEEYVRRCNGTFIEEKHGSIAWHFRNAESDFALQRLHELRDDLAEIIRHKTDFEILEGNKVLEVKSGKYDKGKAASGIIGDTKFDFILAAGDDKTDEFLFKAMPKSATTIKIGITPSVARYNILDHSQLLNFLRILIEL